MHNQILLFLIFREFSEKVQFPKKKSTAINTVKYNNGKQRKKIIFKPIHIAHLFVYTYYKLCAFIPRK